MRFKCLGFLVCLGMLLYIHPLNGAAEEKEIKSQSEIPSHVLNISKDNTYPNSTEDQEILEAEELTNELINDTDVRISNPELIEMLNQTSIKPSPFAVGYRGEIFLGRWPLSYESKETNINWEYQQINLNELNNQGGQKTEEISYDQKEEKHIKGGLTSKASHGDQMMKLILLEARAKSKLPLSLQSSFGRGTKQTNTYAVPVNKVGQLKAYAPAVNEKGEVAFGDVYIQLKGSNMNIDIKNVTRQGVGAWIPIQDHVSFSYQLK
ncbi:YfkD family protein [Halobacillus sp. A1]|uniref:YfkD famly protein n=1 Tax=Halobacillus sp. A1 TaxID=2880262 RepID=UPI0020A6AA83|nr:YfkD famly protein [Halobacillus sp. A1]MCP3030192.1 YfkD family protein [Halobacillus sp. A1]